MRLTQGLAVGLAALAIFSSAPQASAQDRPKIEIVPRITHTAWVESVAFSPDGARVLSGSLDHTIKLWDATTGRLVRTVKLKRAGWNDEFMLKLLSQMR